MESLQYESQCWRDTVSSTGTTWSMTGGLSYRFVAMEMLFSRVVGALATVMYTYLTFGAVPLYLHYDNRASFVDRHFPILNQLVFLIMRVSFITASYRNIYKIRYVPVLEPLILILYLF
jgi:hypothetical protein